MTGCSPTEPLGSQMYREVPSVGTVSMTSVKASTTVFSFTESSKTARAFVVPAGRSFQHGTQLSSIVAPLWGHTARAMRGEAK